MIICKYYVYLLKSQVSNRTYVGYTVNIKRRIRQHNGIIKGGAKKTRKGRPWKLVLYVTGFEYERTALQYECRIHHPPKHLRRKGPGIKNKIRIMKGLLKDSRICSTAPLNCDLNLAVFFFDPSASDIWNLF